MATPPAPDSAERWRAVRAAFDAAMELPVGERGRFVARAFPEDDRLRGKLAALVAADAGNGGLLDAAAPLVELLPGLDPEPGRDDTTGSNLGPYRLLREIGRGGMGTVYLAERSDGAFVREVAVKVLRPGLDCGEAASRFLRERQILARLDHPGIARLLDGGTSPDGRPYLVMELVEGRPVTEHCDALALPVAGRITLFLAIADAVACAHRSLVVHRDLKPSNILVTAEGRVKLLDFGIAKLLEPEGDEGSVTSAGRPLLTLSHASPEQVRGEPVTTASDVYSLGVLLYELLAGCGPYGSARGSRATLERAVLATEPLAPSACRPLARDLDAIVLTALRKRPSERYPSVEAFAADLRRYLEGWPVRARRASLLDRAGKLVKRRAAPLAAGGLAVLLLVLAVLLHTERLKSERRLARREAEKAFVRTDLAFGMADSVLRGGAAGDEALEWAERQARALLRVDPEAGAALLRDVARHRMARRDLDGAARLLADVKAAQANVAQLVPLEAAETCRVLGKLSHLRGALDEAAREYERALGLFREGLSDGGARSVHTVIDLGNAFLELDRLDRAAEAYETAIALLGPDDSSDQWGRARNNLGVVAMRRGDFARAARLMTEALPNAERSLDAHDPELGDVFVTTAQALAKAGERARVRELAARGLAIYERSLPSSDPRIAEARGLASGSSR